MESMVMSNIHLEAPNWNLMFFRDFNVLRPIFSLRIRVVNNNLKTDKSHLCDCTENTDNSKMVLVTYTLATL